MTILVTYATVYGSTQEVAETIASTLRTEGLSVDLKPMKAAITLQRYDAVMMGAPLYIGKWPKDAHLFLSQHRDSLQEKPSAIFALGPISTDPNEMVGCRKQLERDLAIYTWLKPIAQAMFVGKFDPSKLTLLHRLLRILPASPLHNLPASDHRDWAGIRAWATHVAFQFGGSQ